MSSSKKFTCKGTLRKAFICLRPRPPPPPLHTVYMYTVYTLTQYTYSHREGGRDLTRQKGRGQHFPKVGRKCRHDWLYLQSINSDKHLHEVPLHVNFLDDNILFWSLYSSLVHAHMYILFRYLFITLYLNVSNCIFGTPNVMVEKI